MGKKKTAKIIDFSAYSGYSLSKNISNDEKKNNNKNQDKGTRKKYTKNNIKEDKKQRKNKPRIRISGKFILFILIIIAVCCFCLFTPSFNVNSVLIQGINGTEYIDPINSEISIDEDGQNTDITKDIIENGEVHIKTNHYSKQEIIDMAEIVMGTNIFQMSIGNIEKNIEKAPYIKSVVVKRVLPSTIKIEVEEREIKAYVDYIGAYMCIDETGYCVDSIKKDDKQDNIPIVRGINPVDTTQGFAVGEILNADDNIKVQRVSNLLNLIEKNELDMQILEIDVTDKENVTIVINNGDIKINFGDMSNMNIKIPFLPKILEDKQGKKGIINMNSDSDDIQPIFSEIIE
ncbi:MAG: FtsQ-type POTRA domain-containing protein [Clostridiales bacterium]|nr:FtsQ-type POTRA domain-containing protein [Clostridiales bacterium]